jgi:hypothetical protein
MVENPEDHHEMIVERQRHHRYETYYHYTLLHPEEEVLG